MFEAMKTLAERSVMERVVLLVNHVLSAEPVAVDRLRKHATKVLRIEFEGWPSLLPALSPLSFCITPAGLVEWLEAGSAATPDLRLAIDASNPALVLAKLVIGERPTVTVDGDAVFASDVNWLIENLRWDLQDDLARIVGDVPAREISRFAGAVAKALREAARALGGLAGRATGSTGSSERPAAQPPPR